ncbi:hypothetical protein LWI28_017287 [Acer negundo]|uniref:Uncharacterized protein n=1 Tax=Acer negundo TaxID=4023 RepID=A0AAD5J6S1_ACENE|nr:hypothetical protein LWI28_017287 [Acer negundo]
MADNKKIQIPRLKLGNQGLEVSKLGFGCMGLTGVYNAPLSAVDGIAILIDAFNKGITFFYTADVYGSHANEVLVGKDGVSEMVVGVLGGGQLGRMLCQAASKMAIKAVILDPLENCPASALSYDHMNGSFDDSAAVQEFAKRCGVLTVEIEHVDVTTLEELEQQGVDCHPKASTIRIIQIDDFEGARRAGDLFGYPLMIKSKRLAYDGRGNAVAKSEEELSSAATALRGFDRGLYVEKWAPFVKVNV